jgi:hypothetical protein
VLFEIWQLEDDHDRRGIMPDNLATKYYTTCSTIIAGIRSAALTGIVRNIYCTIITVEAALELAGHIEDAGELTRQRRVG